MKLTLFTSCLLLIAASWLRGQEDHTSGLAAHWQAEGDGKEAASRWPGQLQDVFFSPGAVGKQAFHFLNPNRSAVLMEAAALDEGFATLSILVWVNAEQHGHSDYDGFGRTILSRTEGGGFALRVMDGLVQFELRTEDGRVHKLLFPAAKVPLHRWTHLTAVYDGSMARVYVDGAATGAAQAVSGRIKKTTLPGARLIIGNEPGSAPQQPGPVQFGSFGWQGMIDDVRFYTRALSAEAVRSCFEAKRPQVSFKVVFFESWRRVFHRLRDPALFAVLLWVLSLFTGTRVWRALAVCAAISALHWLLAQVTGSAFIFHPGAPKTLLPSFGLVGLGYVLWRAWRKRRVDAATETFGPPPGFLAGRLKMMFLGAVVCCLVAFPAAFVTALVWRLPIPFGKYESGMHGAGMSWFAVLFYGAIGGFAVLGTFGAIGGAVAHQRHAPDSGAVLRLNLLLAFLFATLAVGLLSGRDLLIGKW